MDGNLGVNVEHIAWVDVVGVGGATGMVGVQ